MKVEYDVEVPDKPHERRKRQTKYAGVFWDFYDSDHQNVKLDYESETEAKRAQTCMCMVVSRNKIFDVNITRRKNTLYMIRRDNHVDR